MSDYDLIDRTLDSTTGETVAGSAYGSQNDFIGDKGPIYIPKSSQSQYLYELERYELEKEIINTEELIKSDLEKENTNYNSRLEFSLMNNMVQIDLDCENIVYKYNLWDGQNKSICTLDIDKHTNFSLYDIYLKIEKKSGDFTKKDILNLIYFKIRLAIGGSDVFVKDFFSMCFFELIEDNDIFIEPNIIYLKAYTFENMLYGIPYYFLKYHEIRITSSTLPNKPGYYDYSDYSDYSIDIIYSGKNLSSIDIKPEHMKNMSFEQILILSQTFFKPIKDSKQKFNINFNHPSQLIMFFLWNEEEKKMEETDELNKTEINKFGLSLDDNFIWWEDEELIKINLLGINLYLICIDPQLQNYTKFCSYIKNKFDPKTLRSINFSRIDKTEFVIDYDSGSNSYKKYNLYINGLNINILRIISGMAGLTYCQY